MLQIRPSAERGHAEHGWLDSYHTFSFADYHDPRHMGFSCLRVINEDRIAGGAGFPTHPHRDMEIITYVLEGELEHRDSLGNGSIIRPGDAQKMSAGSGIRHSESNSGRQEVHLLQIWIEPAVTGVPPTYGQGRLPIAEELDRLHLVVSPDGAAGSLGINQNARLWAGRLTAGGHIPFQLAPGRTFWLQVVRGAVSLATGAKSTATSLVAGDGIAGRQETSLDISASSGGEVLLFDLP